MLMCRNLRITGPKMIKDEKVAPFRKGFEGKIVRI